MPELRPVASSAGGGSVSSPSAGAVSRVLSALEMGADESGQCSPSLYGVGRALGMRPRSVRKVIVALLRDGRLVRLREADPATHRPAVYRLTGLPER